MYRFESRRYDSGNHLRGFPIRVTGLAVAIILLYLAWGYAGRNGGALVVEYKKKMATA